MDSRINKRLFLWLDTGVAIFKLLRNICYFNFCSKIWCFYIKEDIIKDKSES